MLEEKVNIVFANSTKANTVKIRVGLGIVRFIELLSLIDKWRMSVVEVVRRCRITEIKATVLAGDYAKSHTLEHRNMAFDLSIFIYLKKWTSRLQPHSIFFQANERVVRHRMARNVVAGSCYC